jgi:hypothetical protein
MRAIVAAALSGLAFTGLSTGARGESPALPPLPPDAVARVGDAPISVSLLAHWQRIARRSGARRPAARREALAFLVSAEWIRQEAALQHLHASDRRVRTEYLRQKHQSFPQDRDFRQFLRETGQTVADMMLHVRLDILANKIRRKVTAGLSRAAAQRALEAFVKDFQRRWKAVTVCRAPGARNCGQVI